MRNLKKLLALLLALVMVFSLMTGLTGCEDDDTEYADEDEDEEDDGKKDEDGDPDGPTEADPEDTDPDDPEPDTDKNLQVVSQICYDDHGLQLTLEDYTWDEYSYFFRFTAVNSSDHYIFSIIRNANLNGYRMYNPDAHLALEAGESGEMTLELIKSKADLSGVTEIYSLLFDFTLMGHGDEIIADSEPVTVYIAPGYQETEADGTVLYNKHGLLVVLMTKYDHEPGAFTMYFYIENNTGRNISVSLRDFVLNRCSCSGFGFSTDLRNGEREISENRYFTLDEIDIDSMDDIHNLRGQITALDNDLFERFLEEDIDHIFDDGNFMYYPNGAQSIYFGNNLELLLKDITVEESRILFHVFASLWYNHPEYAQLQITHINGNECSSTTSSIMTNLADIAYLELEFPPSSEGYPGSVDAIETITFTLSYSDSNGETVVEIFTLNLN